MSSHESSPGNVGFCPKCGKSLVSSHSLVNEYWFASKTIFYCWCAHCSWSGEIRDTDSFKVKGQEKRLYRPK